MKKQILIFLSCFLFSQGIACADLPGILLPSETVVLELPNNSDINWKEITYTATPNEVTVERIPTNQSIQNWSELIHIKYYPNTKNINLANINIDDVVDHYKQTILSSYPVGKASFNIIDKQKTNIIYEWILHEPHKDTPTQQDIARIFLTDNGSHVIGITRRFREMVPEEREKWLNLLKDSTTVMTFNEAKNKPQGLSIVYGNQTASKLGFFQDWDVVNHATLKNGFSFVARMPPIKDNKQVSETLEMFTMSTPQGTTIEDICRFEKEKIQKRSPKKVSFDFLKKSPSEVIYSYSHPHEGSHITGVVRTLISNHSYQSIMYNKKDVNPLNKDKILTWKERLETIKK